MLPDKVVEIMKSEDLDDSQNALSIFAKQNLLFRLLKDRAGKQEEYNITHFLNAIEANEIKNLSKVRARVYVDVICSLAITMTQKGLNSFLTFRNMPFSILLLQLCAKAEYFDSLPAVKGHANGDVLDCCTAPDEVITNWKDISLTARDMLNQHVKDKHSEFSAWKALKFLGTVAGCAVFVWGNIQPILKENQKLNALVACLGLSAVVVSGFSSYFFKVDPSSHGVPNELYTGR